MNLKTLRKLRRQLEQLLLSPAGIKGSELRSIAEKLGRKKKKKQGGEPTWVREDCPQLRPPLSIPQHATEMKKWTAKSVIHQLLSDVDEWEIYLAEKAGEEGNEEDDDD